MAGKDEIKCHLCGGQTQLRFEELKVADGKVTVRESPYYSCGKCGEEFSTQGQMQELSGIINERFSFSRPVISAGRSLAITLPKDLAAHYGIRKGAKVRLVPGSRTKIELIVG